VCVEDGESEGKREAEGEIEFKELTPIIVRLGEPRPDGEAGRCRLRAELTLQPNQKVSGGRTPSCSGEFSLCSIQAFNWLAETHLHYGRSPTSPESTNLHVGLIQETCLQKYLE
jgi:hypothetical protein